MSDKGDYSEIGALLRQAREEMQLTLDQAAHRLHIRGRYLHALELGRFDEMPGVTYARGYLLAYAGFLKLDKREIIRRFEQIEGELAKKGFYFPQVLVTEKTPSRWFVWGGFGLALALYLFWLAFVQPPRVEISLVEPFRPPESAAPTIPASIFKDVACLRPQEALYPPCHAAGVNPYRLLPLSGGQEALRAKIATVEEAKKRRVELPWLKASNE
jgi:cytoskeleton protein RodZ